MSDTLTQTENQQTQTTDTNQNGLGDALWNGAVQQPAIAVQEPIVDTTQQQAQTTTTEGAVATTTATEEVMDINDWLKKEFEVDSVDGFRTQWNELRKLKEQAPPQAQEVKWVYDESKEDEIFSYINQKKQLAKLENYEITDAAQASEIIKANLQFKYKDLDSKQIDRLYQRQYALPERPIQNLESDEEFTQVIANWQRQVQEKEQDIMIDAKIAKPELANYKSQLVLPDIPKANNAGQQQGPTQEDLAAQEAFRNSFVQKLGTDYRNFKGYNTIAKDGEVELPISYSLNDDEKLAFNPTVQKAVDNINTFLDNDLGWWDAQSNSFNINKMQEDLYLLLNKDKVFSKLAGDSAAKRYEHHLKVSNNIKLNGVNNQMDIPNGTVVDEKVKQKQMADTLWGI
jgi:hypothetical protein